MDKKKALGRGMASLIPDPSVLNDDAPPPKSYFYCGIENISPNKEQPRKNFNEETIEELASSIKERGILQPILVRRVSEFEYELIAGERRWRAAQRAGLKQVPVIIRDSSSSEQLEEALIENIQREDLNDIEEARAYARLIEVHKYTQDQLAKKICKKRSTIANSLRLLMLSEKVQQLVAEKKLSAGHARALLSIEDYKRQEDIAEQIVMRELSVRQTEALVKEKAQTTEDIKKPEAGGKEPYISALEQELTQHFKTKVQIHLKGKQGKVEIEFFDEGDLNRIIALLKA